MTNPLGNPPPCDWCGSHDVETVEDGPYWLHRCKAPRCAHEWIGGARRTATMTEVSKAVDAFYAGEISVGEAMKRTYPLLFSEFARQEQAAMRR